MMVMMIMMLSQLLFFSAANEDGARLSEGDH